MNERSADSSVAKKFATLLRQYDEALSSEDRAEPPDAKHSGLSLADAKRFEQLCHCVELLDEARRDRGTHTSESDLPRDLTKFLRPLEQLRQIGRFEILGEIGRGGCGVVLRARDPKLNRDVALKIPRPEALVSENHRERFLREARAAGSVDHPNIVPIYEVGAEGPISFIAAAYIPGPTLAEWLNSQQDPIDVRQGSAMVAALASGLEHAHARGVVHRDIKPGNILLQPLSVTGESASLADYVPKITDFGLAKLRETTEAVTHTGAVIGTPLYMAPEQAEGRLEEIGPATDIYALGAILFEVLTGQPPLRGESDVDTLRRIVSDDPPLLRIARPRIPRDLEAICLKCLEKRPPQRYLTAGDLSEDLGRFLGGTPTHARPIGTTSRAWRWARRRPTTAALMLVSAVLFFLLASGVGVYNVQLSNALRETETERNRAEAERRRAENETLQTRQLLYTAEVRSAYDAWHSMNRSSTLDLLKRQIPNAGQPDLREFAWRWLWGQCHGEMRSFVGHSDEVFSVEFSPDGKSLATASKDGTAKMWDVATGKLQHTLIGHTTEVTCVRFSPDGTQLATGSEDCQVIVWNPQTGKSLFSLSGHEDHILTIAFSPDGRQLATGGRDKQVRLFNLDTQELVRALVPQVGVIRGLSYSPDGQTVAACDENGRIHRWDTASWEYLSALSQTEGPLFAIDFQNDSRHLVAAGRDSILYYWDLLTGTCATISEIDMHHSWIRDSKLSPDGSMVANANQNGFVLLWSINDREESKFLHQATVQGHMGQIWRSAWSSDGKYLATAGADHLIKLWNVESQLGTSTYEPATGYTWDLDFSGDSKSLVSTHEGGMLRTWNVASHKLVADIQGPWTQNKTLLALDSEQARAVISAVDHSSWCLIDYFSGKVLFEKEISPARVDTIAYCPKRSMLAVVNEEGRVFTVPISSREQSTTFHNNGRIGCIAYSPDGESLLTCSREIRLWDAQTGKSKWGHRHFDSDARIARYSPDGKAIAAALGHRLLVLIDSTTGQIIGELQNDEGYISSLAFTPDSRTLAVGTWDTNAVTLWDVRTRQEYTVLKPNLKNISSLAFSPDGSRLVAAGETLGEYVHPYGMSQIVEWVLPPSSQ